MPSFININLNFVFLTQNLRACKTQRALSTVKAADSITTFRTHETSIETWVRSLLATESTRGMVARPWWEVWATSSGEEPTQPHRCIASTPNPGMLHRLSLNPEHNRVASCMGNYPLTTNSQKTLLIMIQDLFRINCQMETTTMVAICKTTREPQVIYPQTIIIIQLL